jgi:hypothetical protein
MAIFDFTISKKPRKSNSTTPVIKIIESKVTGVVFIDLNGNYSVKVNGKYYTINIDNYNCKTADPVYSINPTVDAKRLIIYRSRCSKDTDLSYGYLPFAPGSLVKGNIVTRDGYFGYIFNIKKVYREKGNAIATEAYNFWINNWDTINKSNEELIIKEE